jgi:hypothetical protein
MEETVRERVEKLVNSLNTPEVMAWRISDNNHRLATYNPLHIDEGPRYYLIRGNTDHIAMHAGYPKGYLFMRIEKNTGDMFTANGNKVRGSVYADQYGIEFVGREGLLQKK